MSPNQARGSFYYFSAASNPDCDPGSGALPIPNGLAMAIAIPGIPLPEDYLSACMGINLNLGTNN
jgi:hypothetical protein